MFIYNTFILSQKPELLIPWGFPAFYPNSTVENGIIKQRTTNIKLFRHFFWLFTDFLCWTFFTDWSDKSTSGEFDMETGISSFIQITCWFYVLIFLLYWVEFILKQLPGVIYISESLSTYFYRQSLYCIYFPNKPLSSI